tara:strand:- start:4275 stop:4811 length:537 start_codon:yes stop_codon:yes gene_type:complete
MAGFHTKTFTDHDDWMTPVSAWRDLIHNQIVKHTPKVIWEPFYGDGTSGTNLETLFPASRIIHQPEDFFVTDHECDIIITNPPFTLKKQVFQRLVELGKPFIILCPSSMINTRYMADLFADHGDAESPLQICIPRKRIQFLKMVDGKVDPDQKGRCNFDCFYYCWKMGLREGDILWMA